MVLISNFRKFLCQSILSRRYFGHFSKIESTKPVAVSWRCSRPSDRRYPGLVQFTEDAVTAVARKLDKEEAVIRYVGKAPPLSQTRSIIAMGAVGGVSREQLVKVQPRKEPHRTTRTNGKCIIYPNHITANFFSSKQLFNVRVKTPLTFAKIKKKRVFPRTYMWATISGTSLNQPRVSLIPRLGLYLSLSAWEQGETSESQWTSQKRQIFQKNFAIGQ